MKETLYRFELSFAGEQQGVGILQGIDDTSLFRIRNDLYSRFDSLPDPGILETPDDSPVVFWFTENGLAKYADAINYMSQKFSNTDWGIVAMSLTVDEDASTTSLSLQDALYRDSLQVAFARSSILECMFFDFKELSHIDTCRKEPLIYARRAAAIQERKSHEK